MRRSHGPSGGRGTIAAEPPGDEYASGACRWWHRSGPSPELIAALEDEWLAPAGWMRDLGCGLGSEVGYLVERGFRAVGMDLSAVAVRRAQERHPLGRFLRGDALHVPFATDSFDVVLDRGCFHYIPSELRGVYEHEVRRVIRPGGRFLLRACLASRGARNSIGLETLPALFGSWTLRDLQETKIPSDTRSMPSLVARLECAK